MTTESRLSELRKQRAADWESFLLADEQVTGRVRTVVSAFDGAGNRLDTSAGIVCASGERICLLNGQDVGRGVTLCTDRGLLSASAIQDAGIPSKLFVSYAGRLLLLRRPEGKFRFDVCYVDAVGRVSPAMG